LDKEEQVKEVKDPDSLDQEVLEIKEDLEIKEGLAIKEDLVKLVGGDCVPRGLIKECSIKNSMKRFQLYRGGKFDSTNKNPS
jgi:hypothetical protein